MKFLRYLLFIVVASYVLVLATAAYFFSDAERYQERIKQFISEQTRLQIEFDDISTTWQAGHPGFIVRNFKAVERSTGQVTAQFDHFAGRFQWPSLLMFWPKFSELVIESPYVTMESIPGGGIRIGGMTVQPSHNKNRSSVWLLSWVLSQGSADLHNGNLHWLHTDGTRTQFADIVASYKKQDGQRKLIARMDNDKGIIGVHFDVQGNLLKQDEWSATLNVLAGEDESSLSTRKVDLNVSKGKGEVIIPELYAERALDIVRVLGSGSELDKWLLSADLTGVLNDVRLQFSVSLFKFDNWKFSARASQLGWRSTQQVPGLTNVYARVSLDQHGGELQYNIQNSELSWPRFLSYSIPVDKAVANLAWQYRDNTLHLGVHGAELKNSDIDLQNIDVAFDKRRYGPGYLVAKTDFQLSGLKVLRRYFPKQTAILFKKWWSGAFKRVDKVDGTVSYIGETSAQALTTNKAQIVGSATAQGVELDYGFQQQWPVFETPQATVKLKDRRLTIAAEKGTIGLSKVSNAQAHIAELFRSKRHLKLKGDLSGPLAHVVDFLQKGPLIKKRAEQEADELTTFVTPLSGEYSGNLSLDLPFESMSKARVSGVAKVSEGEIEIPQGVVLKKINGEIKYTQSTVKGNDISAEFLGGELLANVTTLRPGQPPAVRIAGAGDADVDELKPWLGAALTSTMSGSADWSGYVDITRQGVKVNVESALLGVVSSFPEPFNKKEDDAVPLEVMLSMGPALRNNLHINYGSNVQMRFRAAQQTQGNLLEYGNIDIGLLGISSTDDKPGVYIDVDQDAVNLDEWIDSLQALSQVKVEKKAGVNFVDQLRQIRLKTEQVTLFGKQLGATQSVARSDDGRVWQTIIDGDSAFGTAVLSPFAQPAKYDLKLSRLVWPYKSAKQRALEGLPVLQNNEADDRDPSTFPIVTVQADEFTALGKSWGQLRFNAFPDKETWQMDELFLKQPGAEIVLSGVWQPRVDEPGTQTQMTVAVESSSTGAALQVMGFPGLLEDGNSSFTADISWLGSPMTFGFEKLDGKYDLEVRKASFPKLNSTTGRVFGLLNVNSLSRRLRLDFQDVFGQGLFFDRMVSNGLIVKGDVLLRSFFIYGPSVYVQANGKVGLADEDYDLELLVSPQLGGNLALLSALSNPAAGAVVFLAQKMFKKQFNQAIVYTYTVDGSWDKPNIVRVTDDGELGER